MNDKAKQVIRETLAKRSTHDAILVLIQAIALIGMELGKDFLHVTPDGELGAGHYDPPIPPPTPEQEAEASQPKFS